MSVYGIVAEYNPFHNGHKYQIDKIHENSDCDGIVAVMSGNFAERGETAIMSKYARAKASLLNGVDLVLELPVPYTVSSAESFAFSAVSILNSTGVVNKLSFGSECGDINCLISAADAVMSDIVDNEIKEQLKKGVSYPTARMNSAEKLFGKKISSILKNPNNILGVEYIKAIKKLNCNIVPTTVLRVGAEHDSYKVKSEIASASLLRQMLINNENIEKYVPENSFPIYQNEIENGFAPANMKALETAILASIRSKTADDFKTLPDVSEGIENRIISAAKTSLTLTELYDTAKTKRYTHSRIRRIVLYSFLGITKEMQNAAVPYLRVLGMTAKGKELLRKMRTKATLPVIMTAADSKKIGGYAGELFDFECKTTDIFNLSLPKNRQCGTDMTDNLVRIE